MSKDLKYRLIFLGSAEPFIVPKIKPTTIRSKIREGVKMISAMEGYVQIYHIEKLSLELTKRNMTTSIFLTTVTQTFKSKDFDVTLPRKISSSINDEDDVWLFCGHDNVKTRKLPGVIQRSGSR